MKDLRIRRGETLTLEITDDESAVSVTFSVKETPDSTAYLLEETALFVDGVATLVVSDLETSALATGDYVYQLLVEYAEGVEIFPEAGNCDDDDCALPTFTVCESLLGSVS